MKKLLNSICLAIAFLSIVLACNENEEIVPIAFGKDQCAYCKMTISNPQFGAELITDKGRVLKYDATECMVNQLKEEETKYRKLYAVPYHAPKKLKGVHDLRFLISPDFRSPMGAGLTAYSDTTQLAEKYYAQLLSWEQLLEAM